MTTYIARFKARHRIVQVEQHSIFIWQQESGEIDEALLSNKIKREAALHFFWLVSGKNYEIEQNDISVKVCETEPFVG